MTAKLDKSIKRELEIDGKVYTITIAPDGLKVTEKGRRNGQELSWRAVISGDAALNESLKASVDASDESFLVGLAPDIDRVRRRRPALVERPAANGASLRGHLQSQLGLRGRQRFAALREFGHPVLKAQELDRRSETLARRSREHEQFLTDFARQMRRRSLPQQRRHTHRLATRESELDVVQVGEKARQSVVASAEWSARLRHCR